LYLGLAFLLLGALNVWLVLESTARVKSSRPGSVLLTLHRIGGYAFIALFAAMSYFMLARLRNATADTSPTVTLHLALALILSPLLFIKVLIARYYKSHYNLLLPLGLTIFVVAFVLIAGVAGPRLIRTSHVQQVRLEPTAPPVPIDLNQSAALMQQRCSKCHNLDRIYKTTQSHDEWRNTVNRMADYAAGSPGELQFAEIDRIVDYLAATQSPATPAPRTPAPPRRDHVAVAFISFVCLTALVLIVRRPANRALVPTPPPSQPPVQPPAPAAPLVLQLIRITPQTPDAKTLRFAVQGRAIEARPGQFLTFHFLFDGRRVIRCYSICSSPARTGYIEITPKRLRDGCASVYLNERASIGLTVEATGPFGQFTFDSADHRQIVLIAAGSGITPMMSMLHYIDDLCLGTPATLLYCVRSAADIIFRSELDDLQARLPNFRCRVLTSDTQGRITADFITQSVPHITGRDFFLCGPPPFMDAVRAILTDLGVTAGHIHQETFGTPPSQPADTSTGIFTASFTRSAKTVSVRADQTLLQSAANEGITIPSACRQGQCGTCKTRLLEGQVQMACDRALDPVAKSQNYILPCVAYPQSNLKLDA
jgi:ferredoxin-NADP reductase